MKQQKEVGMTVKEGYFPFLEYRTYYRIVGAEHRDKTPLILLHGGPGSTHNYLEMLDALGTERPLITYDQLGCGRSYLEGHPELWKAETWLEELESLYAFLNIREAHILGQSWGGMLAQLFALKRRNVGIRSLILSSTLSSAALWSSEQHRRIRKMSETDREAIRQAEETGDYRSPAYLEANERFMERYCNSPAKEGDPECLRREKIFGEEAYRVAWGPNEYTPSGTLKDYDITERLSEIKVPVLIISGTDDLCSPLIAKTMHDRLPGSRWELFPGCRHTCYVQDNPRYLAVVRDFLMNVEK